MSHTANILQLHNPIPESINDPAELSQLFKDFGIVPYYGTEEATSHNMLRVIHELSELSPSHQACKLDKNSYVFSGGFDYVAPRIPGVRYSDEDKPISDAEKAIFVQQLVDLGLSPLHLQSILEQLDDSLADSGNAYLHIKVTKLNRVRKVYIRVIPYREIAFLERKNMRDPDVFVVTEQWDQIYWKKKPPKLIWASVPERDYNWQPIRDGVQTILHIRSPKGSKYYGRPRTLSALFWMFVEASAGDQTVRVSSSDFVSQMIMAFEEPPPERITGTDAEQKAAFKGMMTEMRKVATVEGTNPKVLGGVQYPHGGKPPLGIKMNLARDPEYLRFVTSRAADYIYAAHHWDRQLSGLETVGANNGGDVYLSILKIKNIGVIKPAQTMWGNICTDLLKNIFKVYRFKEVYDVRLVSVLDPLFEAELEASKGSLANTKPKKKASDDKNGDDTKSGSKVRKP